ncbi:MAG: hypothetical protein JSU86_02240 [Phycisphaerales bacterium]|nr:MAG: hypothetical protein JSU86_02240 [Phycisphaerales bacterium]
MKRLWQAIAVVIAVGFAVPGGHASTVPKKNMSQLVGESAVIMVGTVTGVSYEMEQKTGEVYTKVRLQRLRPVKGAEHLQKYMDEGITLSFLGGMLPDGTMHVVAGMPRLQLMQTYLLFLRGGEWTINPITGWHQGAFRVLAGAQEGSHVLANLSGEILMGVEGEQLRFQPVPKEKLGPGQTCSPEGRPGTQVEVPGEERQGGELKLREGVDPGRLGYPTKDSIYREDNVAELAEQDAQRAKLQKEEIMLKNRQERERLLHESLGGKPMGLEDFEAMIKKSDERVRQQYDPVYRTFHIEPVSLPREQKSLSPPSSTTRKPGSKNR